METEYCSVFGSALFLNFTLSKETNYTPGTISSAILKQSPPLHFKKFLLSNINNYNKKEIVVILHAQTAHLNLTTP